MDHMKAIIEAAHRIAPHIRRTPCDQATERLWFKREDCQISGSFKIRGVANAVYSTPEPHRRRGLVCVSSGNTGRALAYLARSLQTKAYIYVPEGLYAKHTMQIQAGATVVTAGTSFAEASRAAREFARDHGLLFCSPGSSWDFTHGAATVGLEIAQLDLACASVFVPAGGGGLAAGVGLAMASGQANGAPRPRVFAVQTASSPLIWEYFHFGAVKSSGHVHSLADSLTGDLEDGANILDVAQTVLSDVLKVDEDEIRRAHEALRDRGVVVDPSAAVGYAGYLQANRGPCPPGTSCVILTGTGDSTSSS